MGSDEKGAKCPLDRRQPIRSFLYNPGRKGAESHGVNFKVLIALLVMLLIGVGALAHALAWTLFKGTAAPALRFEPRVDNAVDSKLIWVKLTDVVHSRHYSDRLMQLFQQEYNGTDARVPPLNNCAYGGVAAEGEKACFVDITALNKACSRENANYGYDHGEGTPCVLLRLDKIEGWTPEAYKTREDLKVAKELGMPSDLLEHIEQTLTQSSNNPLLDTIWMSCEGEGPEDRENIGPLQYYSPAFKNSEFQGVPAYYFPYLQQKGYMAPFLFVKFVKPQYNIVIQVTCRAWVKNIGPEDPLGKVQFVIFID